MIDYDRFFKDLTGHAPFPYQLHLGNNQWPEFLEIPTGLGKTAAVIIAWLNKLLNGDTESPRRLVYCMPMRVLVEQTQENTIKWLEKAASYFQDKGVVLPRVQLLMGGENDTKWAEHLEEPAIIIGTQDMLLSRALMRGYGMSRYQWPIHFAVLHNDVLWVFDEIQLMGAGLTTSAQLEAFRRRFKVARSSRSLWASATLNPHWLETVDMKPHLRHSRHLMLSEEEQEDKTVKLRREAVKRLNKASTVLTAENQKQSANVYSEELAKEVLARHVTGTTTLVILNTVERAQNLMSAIDRQKPPNETLLVHSRYRPLERKILNDKLGEKHAADGTGRIIVATQAVEAGVDMTSRILFTELAPWSSLVQRFGRCNRYGEANECGGADVFWIDFETEAKLEIPYEPEVISGARNKLTDLSSASAADLPATDEDAPLHSVLRAKDFRDLFNTDPDLSGFDVDVSPYIRDADDLDVQVFWRDLTQGVEGQLQARREELCRASFSQAKILMDRLRKQETLPYCWDSLDGKWKQFRGNVRPGLVLMLDSKAGGYSERFGLLASSTKAVPSATQPLNGSSSETYGDDWRSRQTLAVELYRHLTNAEDHGNQLCQVLGVIEGKEAIIRASRWHDVGKAHAIFQATMHNCPVSGLRHEMLLLAKSSSKQHHQRKYFRHELASMLAWLENAGKEQDTDLIAYLIAAHHGKVRLSLRAMPDEKEPDIPFGPRFARGVWEGDELPKLHIPERETVPRTRMRLDLMELGEGAMGLSWTARTQKLLDTYGPFRLAWLETLVRLADWRASGSEQEGNQ